MFEVNDSRSGNKIGVDGVLLGSWVPIDNDVTSLLDVGCGCGIITLMLAQRAPQARVLGIDIEPNAIEEANLNARNSIFADRIEINNKSYEDLAETDLKFDLIVSNPPFFNSGGNPNLSERMLARHSGSLSPEVLIQHAPKLLKLNSLLALIAPSEEAEKLRSLAAEYGLRPVKECFVKGNPNVSPKRVMLAFRLSDKACESSSEILTIEYSPGQFTPEYISLGQPFYLKF